MKLICDSGSSKTDWAVLGECMTVVRRFTTCGLNPAVMGVDSVEKLLTEELLPKVSGMEVSAIDYYGAGCTPEICVAMDAMLRRLFPNSADVAVASDILGAAKAVCSDSEGIVAIIGTGANSCLYDGRGIAAHTPALGYILGDEGSGAVLGRLFLNALLKGLLPKSVAENLKREIGISQAEIIERVYRSPFPNRFLASMSPFIYANRDVEEVRAIVVDNFRSFFAHNIVQYGRPDMPVNFVGSIAYLYSDELIEAAEAEGFTVGRILKSPLDSLV